MTNTKPDDALRDRARQRVTALMRENGWEDCDESLSGVLAEYMYAFAASELSRGQGPGPRCPKCGSTKLESSTGGRGWSFLLKIWCQECPEDSGYFYVSSLKDFAQFFPPMDVDALAQHWLFNMECNHETNCDRATCACGWSGGWRLNVGEAAKEWAQHVEVVLRRALGGRERGVRER